MSLYEINQNKHDIYAVMGNPIMHSRSPEIFQYFARQTQQDLNYKKILVPLDGFAEAVAKFIAEGGKGLNITLPFKQQAYEIAHQLTERAKLAGAVNTFIIANDGTLTGDNTDGVGLVNDLHANAITIKDARILLLGASGAARGVIAVLLQEKPAHLHIANRTAEKAMALRSAFASLGSLTASGLHDIPQQSFDVIINATSSSLHNEVPTISSEFVTAECCCYDMFYADKPTAFQRWAKNHGAAFYFDGLGMLVEQAAEAFYLWRGIRPDAHAVLQQLQQQRSHQYSFG